MESNQKKRMKMVLTVADGLVEKVAVMAQTASSPQELKQLTGALKELKDIQGLKEQTQPESQVRVVLEKSVEELAK